MNNAIKYAVRRELKPPPDYVVGANAGKQTLRWRSKVLIGKVQFRLKRKFRLLRSRFRLWYN